MKLLVTKKIIIIIRDRGEEHRVIRALHSVHDLDAGSASNLEIVPDLQFGCVQQENQAKSQHGVFLIGKIVKRSKSNKPPSLFHFLAEKR